MGFKLGNHNIDEVLFGIVEDNNNILYTLDQLTNANIEISAESTDITDKKGNVVRTLWNSKSGTFTATNAWLHPEIMNAGSGSKIEYATSDHKIDMPNVFLAEAGKKYDVTDAKDGTIKVIGVFGNGANQVAKTSAEIADMIADNKITLPATGDDLPDQYLISYERAAESGAKLTNMADKFPEICKVTYYCSYVDACGDLKPCYVVIPKFMADPNMTISLDKESQEIDFKGNLQIDYCSTDKALYYIYYPDSALVVKGEAVE